MEIRATKERFFINQNGKYIGSFSGTQSIKAVYEDGTEVILHAGVSPEIPDNAKEIACPPDDPRQEWNGSKNAWLPTLSELRTADEKEKNAIAEQKEREKKEAAKIEASKPNYGSVEDQLKYATENGLDALVSRNIEIRNNFKKTGEK